MQVGLRKADKLNNARMIEPTHNLHFFEDICAL